MVEELVSGPHGVTDGQMTASGSWDNRHGPKRGRLHYGDEHQGKTGVYDTVKGHLLRCE